MFSVSLIIVFPATLRPSVDILVELTSLMAPDIGFFSCNYRSLLHCVLHILVQLTELKQLSG